ncbi:hypothetical protein [Pelobacter seleniigenes]|uniref:hypothetical protein n=1 Tax=Pelobacter seleniigenes TaxID=407188 RepID=UPI0004A6E446|nr:hypothetical protein [Pelobacter seleniigenes]
MDINSRTPEVKKSHGESLVKLGEKLQESVIYAIFVTPFLYFGKALFEGEKEKISNYIAVVVDGSDFLIVLLILMSVAVCFGIWFKNKGYDLIEAANRESNT